MKNFLAVLFLPVMLALLACPVAAQTPTPPPYSILGGSTTLAVTSSNARVALPAAVGAYGAVTIYNGGAVDAFVAMGDSSAVAATTGGCVIASGPGPACLIRAGTYLTVWAGANTYLAAITSSSTTTLTIYQATGPVQLGKAGGSATPSGAAGGDLSGTYPNPTVVTGTSGATIPLLNGNNTYSGTATFSNASVKMTALPTADPHVAGQLWNNAGVLSVSAG